MSIDFIEKKESYFLLLRKKVRYLHIIGKVKATVSIEWGI
jgi:hypothetical protein